MTVENIFEYATRNKVRFQFKGQILVENLWDLSLANLDSIYKELNKQSKHSEEESLLNIKTQEDELLNVQIAIVKHIVSVKLAEKEARKRHRLRRCRSRRLCLSLKQSRMKLYRTVLLMICRRCLMNLAIRWNLWSCDGKLSHDYI